jgi:hypothetical protein
MIDESKTPSLRIPTTDAFLKGHEERKLESRKAKEKYGSGNQKAITIV